MNKTATKGYGLTQCLLTAFLSLTLPLMAAAQSVVPSNVSGTVVDENDDPLVGVSVMITGTACGISTDIDGNYSLNVPEGGG